MTIIYLDNLAIKHVIGMGYHNLKQAVIDLRIICVGDTNELDEFIKFSRGKLIEIVKSYSMDWHVKPEKGEQIEFILDIMGKILELQGKGKLDEAKALFDLVEIVLPEFQNDSQFNVAQDLRNIIYDHIYLEKK